MIPTSDVFSSASNWQLFKSWVKHKLRSAFTWNRKTRVLEDPAALLQEARARGDNPYSRIRLRDIKRHDNPRSRINRAAQHFRNDFARIGIDVSSVTVETDLLSELQNKLLTQARRLQIKTYKQGTLEDMQAFSKLVNQVGAANWPAVLNDLTLRHPAGEAHKLADFVRPLELLITASAQPSTDTLMQTDVRIPADQLLGKEVFLMSGDISRMNELQTPPIQAIACPYTPKGSKNETVLLKQLSEIDTGLAKKGFLEAIKKVQPGLAVIAPSPALQDRGFSHMVHAMLPHVDSGNINSELVAAYQSTIEAAHRKNLSSIAIPIFSSEMNLSPQRAATIVCVAISRYMSSHPYETKPPKVYLVCPGTEKGQETQRYINHYLSQKMPKPPKREII
ncbi:macro domain-containing protein [Endozoicomonas sp. ALC020]|uniref:macro domain-containing protein n=1 Tax=unclassified Endozoicomonas TaxID=2644528 RepID=UPI003BB14113